MAPPEAISTLPSSKPSTLAPSRPPSVAAGSSVEVQAAAFASDPRVHISTVTKRWQYEDDDGNEFEYDNNTGTWVSVVDEDLVKAQQAAYSVSGVDEETPAAPVLKRQNKKRKEPEDYTSSTLGQEAGPSTKRRAGDDNGVSSNTTRKSKNTAVYVTHLPLDATASEIITRFSKCGVLEEDDEGNPKVKLYARDSDDATDNGENMFSGDALVVYFKEESVILAVAMLDDAELRIGEPSSRMHVQPAQFGHKERHGKERKEVTKERKNVDRKKATRRIVKMQRKLEDWDPSDTFGPSLDPEELSLNNPQQSNKNSRVVVLKHMFTLKELEEDASLLLDLKEDVREECSTLGEVTNVVLYDEEPEGVMTVKFRDPVSAQACVLKMQGRFFAGRRVEAYLYDGRQRFNKSGSLDAVDGDGDEAESKRLNDFTTWLMTEGE